MRDRPPPPQRGFEPPRGAFEPPDADVPPPPPPPRRVWAPFAAGFGVAALVVAVTLGAVLLPAVLMAKPEPQWERQAWRVSDAPSVEYLDAQLQRGWQVERADSDTQGTTYVLKRDPVEPTPRPRPRELR